MATTTEQMLHDVLGKLVPPHLREAPPRDEPKVRVKITHARHSLPLAQALPGGAYLRGKKGVVTTHEVLMYRDDAQKLALRVQTDDAPVRLAQAAYERKLEKYVQSQLGANKSHRDEAEIRQRCERTIPASVEAEFFAITGKAQGLISVEILDDAKPPPAPKSPPH